MTSSAKIQKEFGGKIVSPKPPNSKNVYSEDSGIYNHSVLQERVLAILPEVTLALPIRYESKETDLGSCLQYAKKTLTAQGQK